MIISVIIVSLNGKKFLEEYLPIVMKSVKGFDSEVIVVDDHSTDDSIEYLKGIKDKNFRFMKNNKKGLCSGRNTGFLNAKGRYLLYLDNDAVIEEGFLLKVLKYFDIDEKIGAVGVAGYRMSDDKQIDGLKLLSFKSGFFRFTKNILNDRLKRLDTANGELYYRTDNVQGAYFICRHDILDELGGFQEVLDPYMLEESEFSYRLLKRGYKIAYAPDTHPHHKLGGTIASKVSPKTKYLSIRNRYIFNAINLHSKSLIIKLLLLLPFRFIFQPSHRKAIVEVFKMRRRLATLRRVEKSASVIKDTDIIRLSEAYAEKISKK